MGTKIIFYNKKALQKPCTDVISLVLIFTIKFNILYLKRLLNDTVILLTYRHNNTLVFNSMLMILDDEERAVNHTSLVASEAQLVSSTFIYLFTFVVVIVKKLLWHWNTQLSP